MRAQTSVEYLLLVGGVVLLVAVVGYYMVSAAMQVRNAMGSAAQSSSLAGSDPINTCTKDTSGNCVMYVGCYAFCANCGEQSFGYLRDAGHWQISTGYYASGATGASADVSMTYGGYNTGSISSPTLTYSTHYSSTDDNVVILWYLDNNVYVNPISCSWDLNVYRDGSLVYTFHHISYYADSKLTSNLVPVGASSSYYGHSNYIIGGAKVLPMIPGTYTVKLYARCYTNPIEHSCTYTTQIP